jgi:steroid delta-isomerase-like uncharacterized protein
MKRTAFGVLICCLALVGCGKMGHELAPLGKQLDAAVNSHDVAGFAKLLTDDVVVKAPDGKMYKGKDSVQAWMAGLMPGFHVESYGWEQSGDTLKWMSTVHSEMFAKMGINPIRTNTMAIFAGDKVRDFSAVLNGESTGKMKFLQFYADVVNGGDVEAVDKYLAEDIIENQPLPPGVPKGRAGVKAFFKMIREAFPDLHGTPSLVLADGDYVVVTAKWEGTNKGSFMGKPATNKSLSWTVVDIIRLADGKAVEHWGWDDLAERMAPRGK